MSKAQRNFENQQDYLATRRTEPKYQSATDILTDPKTRLTSRGRRKLNSLRSVLYKSEVEPKGVAVRIMARVQGLPIARLNRLVTKSSHRLAAVRSLLEDLSTDSRFRAPLEYEAKVQQFTLEQAKWEISSRASAPAKRSAVPHKKRAVPYIPA